MHGDYIILLWHDHFLPDHPISSCISWFGHEHIDPFRNKRRIYGCTARKTSILFRDGTIGVLCRKHNWPSCLALIAFHLNWRISIQIAAITTLLIGLLTYLIYQEQKATKHIGINGTQGIGILKNTDSIDREISFKDGLSDILNNKSLLMVCILGIVFGTAEGSTFSHFTVFLNEDMGLDKVISGLGFALLYIGGVIGMASLGWISDNFLKIKENRFSF